jgi:hypothetical protein
VVPQRYPGRRDDQRGVCAVTEVRLCKDCRYAENTRDRWLCYHRTSIVVPPPDRVTGATREPYPAQCVFMRIDQGMFRPDLCGSQGQYWEARGAGS